MLNELEQKRDQLRKELIENVSRIEFLEKEEIVREYKKLTETTTKDYKKLEELNFQIAQDKMKNCSHIFITNQIDNIWDGHRTDTYKYFGCIKCGLDSRFTDYDYNHYASPLQKEMEHIYRETERNGIVIKEICSLDLARAIYSGILKVYPNIPDEIAIKYFKVALNNIRTNNVTQNVREKRVKRLGLHPSFKSWDVRSVIRND